MITRNIRTAIKSLARLILPEISRESMAPFPYRYTQEDADAVAAVVLSGKLTHDTGHEIADFEREFAQFTGSRYAVSTNSGTSALALACQASGLTPGDEVIVPAYTFVAVAQAVLSAGAIPVFADIDQTCAMNPKSLMQKISKKTRAIIIVHMFGNVADMDTIGNIAKKHHLFLIEDCAQAAGAQYRGKSVGTIGDVGCYSFNIKKAIPTGQGGMVITSNSDVFRRVKAGRNTGIETEGGVTDVVNAGGTYFMTEMEAVLGRSVLRQLTFLNSARMKNYEYLTELIRPITPLLTPYKIVPHSAPSYSRLSFLLNTDKLVCSRDEFIEEVQTYGVPVKKFYPTPLYRYMFFRDMKRNRHVALPFAETFYARHVGMEFSPYWSFSDMRRIANAFRQVIERHKK